MVKLNYPSLTFSYGKNCPLLFSQLDLEFLPGIYCLVGTNGIGKSTLLKILCGLIGHGSAKGQYFNPTIFHYNSVHSTKTILNYWAKMHRQSNDQFQKHLIEWSDGFPLVQELLLKKTVELSAGMNVLFGLIQATIGLQFLAIDEPFIHLANEWHPKILEKLINIYQQQHHPSYLFISLHQLVPLSLYHYSLCKKISVPATDSKGELLLFRLETTLQQAYSS